MYLRPKPNKAPVIAGYYHSIAIIMTMPQFAGYKTTFDEAKQEIIVNEKGFKY